MLHNSTLFAFLLFLNSIILLQVGKANVIPTSISPPTEAPRMNTHSKRWLWEGTRGNYDLILNVRQLLPPDQIKADRLLWVFHSIGCAVDAILDSLKEYTTYRTETDWQERHAKLFHTKADLVGLEVIVRILYIYTQRQAGPSKFRSRPGYI